MAFERLLVSAWIVINKYSTSSIVEVDARHRPAASVYPLLAPSILVISNPYDLEYPIRVLFRFLLIAYIL